MAIVCKNCFCRKVLTCQTGKKSNFWRFSEVLRRCSSTLPFSSDRDPAQSEGLPIHKYIDKTHKRVNMLFACGLTATGALGLREKSSRTQSRRYPIRLTNIGKLKITSVGCGYGYTVFASNNRDLIKVWGSGINTQSQLGFHSSQKGVTKGRPAESGHFDYVMETTAIPIPFDSFSKTKVTQVSCGRAHTLLLTDNEGIFSFGCNSFGQCGREIIEGEIYQGSRKIHCIPHNHFLSPVTQISCGMDHSLFLTKSGEVYGCGWGADGQTGLGSYEKTGIPKLLKGDLEGVKVQQISTFADMSMAVCEDGHLYGWGNSEYYQLASVTDDTQVCTPIRLPFKNIGKIVSAAAGGSICCALNEEGEVFVWGYGILGKGPDLKDSRHPEKIPQTLFGESTFSPSVKVTKIKCGMNHFAAVTNNGELFTWGKNKSGCLGIGEYRDQYFPWKVLVPGEVVDVFCGVDHTVILSKSML
ncbi:RCC1-like G exchanging factor-like protein [Styela clava]